MKVVLKRGWFAPDGSLYGPGHNPHEFPDEWEDQLPYTAVRVSEVPPVKPVAPKAETK